MDSVGTETGKLLSNLAQDSGKDDVGDPEEDGVADVEGEESERGKKRKASPHQDLFLILVVRTLIFLLRSIVQRRLSSKRIVSSK